MVELTLAELIPMHLAVWVDDILTFAPTIDEHLVLLERIFDLLHGKGFKLHAKKCVLFATEVKWCGKLISASGIKHDEDRIQGLVEMPLPTTAGGLMQFLCAANWVRDSIPDFARTAAPIQAKLEAAIQGRKRAKRVASGNQIDWCSDDITAFNALKTTIATSVARAFPDPAAVFASLPTPPTRGGASSCSKSAPGTRPCWPTSSSTRCSPARAVRSRGLRSTGQSSTRRPIPSSMRASTSSGSSWYPLVSGCFATTATWLISSPLTKTLRSTSVVVCYAGPLALCLTNTRSSISEVKTTYGPI